MAGKSQSDLTIYNMQAIPQSRYMNPALTPNSNGYLGLPVISSIYFNTINDGFRYKNMFQRVNDTLQWAPSNMLGHMAEKNYIHTHVNTDLLSFGFRVAEKHYLHFNVTQKTDFRLGLPKQFLTLLWEGNAGLLGKSGDFSTLGFDAQTYTEFGAGYSIDINENLTIGGRIKYLNGLANVYTPKRELSLNTDSTYYTLTAATDFQLYATPGILNITPDSITLDDGFGDQITGNLPFGNNHGVGIDLGVNYKINDKIRVHGSIVDLGWINWSQNAKIYSVPSASFVFNGIDVKPFVDNGFNGLDSLGQEILDSLTGTFTLTETQQSYWAPTFSQFYAGGNYYINEKYDAGLLFRGRFHKGTFRPAVTASFNARFSNFFQASVSYSYADRDFTNLGLGFAMGRYVSWYVASDNLLAPIFPQSGKNFHIHTGLNVKWGYKKKDRDGDGIPDKMDDCPDDPGLEKFNGCPDRDEDNIMDKDDACPDVPGLAEFSGCPDTDGDGIVDSTDACPLKPGPKELNGCPDRDNDKIIDDEDACPDQPGPKATQGCPDLDGDGIVDTEDLCPEKPGEVEHQGCPDTDGDGLYDNEDKCVDTFGPTSNFGCPYGDIDGDGVLDKDDRCPDTPGPAENQGCPFGDLDGDGVTDNIDECPNTPGPVENNGCPELSKEEEEILDMAFKNLEFESGRDIIRSTSYESLDSLASLLKKKPEWKLKLAGHTDNVGNDAGNMLLSQKRATAVKNYLKMKGVEPDERFIVEWYGETKPIYPNDTPEGRQKNRRVEMSIIFE
ncbi:MAG: OmpA family protein [Bacteroidia bacterium]|nr:OmpA family protein [Bacteroidia bacterium]